WKERHNKQGRREIDEEKGKKRKKPQHQQVAEGKFTETLLNEQKRRARTRAKGIAKSGLSGQEDEGRDNGRTDHDEDTDQQHTKEKAAGERRNQRAGKRKGDHRNIGT